jgi:hypothetical protein
MRSANMTPEHTVPDTSLVRLEARDIQRLRLESPEQAEQNASPVPPAEAAAAEQDSNPATNSEHAIFRRNKVGKGATISTGNLGMEGSPNVLQPRSRFEDNEAGDDLVLVTGNVGGDAAKEMVKNLFKRSAN